MKLDILVFSVHPDDAELSCSGTIIQQVQQGKKVGIVDLTRGELGTRGTPAIRHKEATKAADILGISIRDNLNFADGFFTNDGIHQLAIIRKIRQYQPDMVLANALTDRHPDHGRAAQLVKEACFLAGLRKIMTLDEQAQQQSPWRPALVYHYIQDTYIKPDFVVDISTQMEQKVQAIQAFASQFHVPDSDYEADEPATYISGSDFLEGIKARAIEFAKQTPFKYAEGFTVHRVVGVKDLMDLV